MASFLSPAGGAPARLRALLSAPGPLLVPGAYDALSARLVEAAGFDAVYMTGFGTTASLLGMPDVGLLSLPEMVDNAARMARAVDVPLISDADTGYGNAVNVARTVQQFERAGVAAIHLEDQVSPKRCGHSRASRSSLSTRWCRRSAQRLPQGPTRTSSSSPGPTPGRSTGSTRP